MFDSVDCKENFKLIFQKKKINLDLLFQPIQSQKLDPYHKKPSSAFY